MPMVTEYTFYHGMLLEGNLHNTVTQIIILFCFGHSGRTSPCLSCCRFVSVLMGTYKVPNYYQGCFGYFLTQRTSLAPVVSYVHGKCCLVGPTCSPFCDPVLPRGNGQTAAPSNFQCHAEASCLFYASYRELCGWSPGKSLPEVKD